MRFAPLVLVGTLLFLTPRAEAQRSAAPRAVPSRGLATLREAFHLELQRSLRVGHVQGLGGAVVGGVFAGAMTKVALTMPALAPALVLATLPLASPTASFLGWRNGDPRQPRRFLGGLFRLTARLGVGITVGTFALVNTAWNGLDWLRGRPRTSMIDRFDMRARAGLAPEAEVAAPASEAREAGPAEAAEAEPVGTLL